MFIPSCKQDLLQLAHVMTTTQLAVSGQIRGNHYGYPRTWEYWKVRPTVISGQNRKAAPRHDTGTTRQCWCVGLALEWPTVVLGGRGGSEVVVAGLYSCTSFYRFYRLYRPLSLATVKYMRPLCRHRDVSMYLWLTLSRHCRVASGFQCKQEPGQKRTVS